MFRRPHRPCCRPIRLGMRPPVRPVRSCPTRNLEAFFGQQIQMLPAEAILVQRIGRRFRSSVRRETKQKDDIGGQVSICV
jgi:hypothetical protein